MAHSFKHEDYTQKMLKKMYKEKFHQDKTILWVLPTFYFPFKHDRIIATIKLLDCNGHMLKACSNQKKKSGRAIDTNHLSGRLRKPYPNKGYHALSMRNGQSICESGIPFLFDSFDEINKIRTIKIAWSIIYPSKNNACETQTHRCDIHTQYNINFKPSNDKLHYTMHTCDIRPFDVAQNNMFKNYFDEFENITLITLEGDETNDESILCKETLLKGGKTMRNNDGDIFSDLIIDLLDLCCADSKNYKTHHIYHMDAAECLTPSNTPFN